MKSSLFLAIAFMCLPFAANAEQSDQTNTSQCQAPAHLSEVEKNLARRYYTLVTDAFKNALQDMKSLQAKEPSKQQGALVAMKARVDEFEQEKHRIQSKFDNCIAPQLIGISARQYADPESYDKTVLQHLIPKEESGHEELNMEKEQADATRQSMKSSYIMETFVGVEAERVYKEFSVDIACSLLTDTSFAKGSVFERFISGSGFEGKISEVEWRNSLLGSYFSNAVSVVDQYSNRVTDIVRKTSPDRLKRDVNGLAQWGKSEEAQVGFLMFCMPSYEAKLSETEALFLQD
ncbi:hypothetical protein ACMG4P_22180 [Pseudovibrio denitrificans]|uniref:hypothetical protein n=1 Tax=Pseudovibrio denitrificans TaxID=258256 RepID=UPI0039BF21CA